MVKLNGMMLVPEKYEFKTDSETLADNDEMNTTAQSGLIENLWTHLASNC